MVAVNKAGTGNPSGVLTVTLWSTDSRALRGSGRSPGVAVLSRWSVPMRVALLVMSGLIVLPPGPLDGQTLKERVGRLERQVRELRALHGLPRDIRTAQELPAELVGNENTHWGYPGGDCTLLVKEFYVICYAATQRIPTWVTYHLTRKNVQGDVARTDDFRADPDVASA